MTDDEMHTVPIRFRVTRAEYDALDRAAREAGKHRATYVREMVLAEMARRALQDAFGS